MDALFSMMTMDHGQQAMLPSLVFKALVRFDKGLIEMVMLQCSGKSLTVQQARARYWSVSSEHLGFLFLVFFIGLFCCGSVQQIKLAIC